MTATTHTGTIWDTLVGQRRAIEALRSAAAGHGMSQAFLFTGPPGSGRSNAAIAFAAALQCEQTTPGCGTCHSCHTVLAGTHADVSVIRTQRLSLGVDEVRDLVRRSALAPVGRRWQILIVEDADRLTEQANNALLKAIEEPTDRTVWMLCAPTVEDLLPTIRSRCRMVTLSTPSTDEVADFLVRSDGVDGVDGALASYCARASQGHIGRARALARDEDARNRRHEVVSMPARLISLGACLDAATNLVEMTQEEADALTTDLDARERADLDASYGVVERGRRPRDYAPAAAALEKAQKGRAKRRHLDAVDRSLMDLVSVYRDAIALAAGGTPLVNEELRRDVETIVQGATPELNLRRIGWIFDAREQMLEFNVPPALALESMMVALKAPGAGPVKRVAVAIALVVVVVLVAGGGVVAGLRATDSAGGPTPVPPPTGAPATKPPHRDLAPFYDQKLRWSDCSNNHQCAELTVPLDYAHPDGQTIRLALLKVAASGERIGSLVVNPGGPGEPGTSFAGLGAGQFGTPLLQHFDIVGFDPRGTGRSAPVDCLSDEALNTYLGQDPEPSTPAEVTAYARTQRQLAAGCSRLSPALAGHVSTVEAARDMDVLRAALGESTLNYLGSSYGTKLGSTYAQLFPKRVGRFVLDGAVDPTLGSLGSSVQQAAGFQRALDAYAADCIASSGGCFLGSTVAEVEQKISDLLDQVARQPLPAGDRQLTAGNAFYGIALSLYSKAYWPLLSKSLQMALAGDGTGLMVLADVYAARNTDGSFQNNSMEAFLDISCLDDPTAVPAADVPSHYPAFERASPVFGKVFAWALTSCNGFRPRAEEPPPANHAQGAAPIVVIGTTRDPATPYPWAVHLAHYLDSGVLVTRVGDGHTGYHTGNACIDDLVHSYLVSGVVPADGTRC